jgi:putative intracellular protease/amidase
MKISFRIIARACLLAAACLFFVYCTPQVAPQAGSPRGAAASGHYACPPCGSPCDSAVYDHPGTCPVCGMPLVEEGAAAVARGSPKKSVAILVFDGAEIIDFTGPWEVFGGAGFDVFTVAATAAPVTTSMGMKIVPGHTFADAPAPDVLLVPGGGVAGARHSAATLDWVKDTSARAAQTLSVCNGAFILASAGLLDGLTATTTFHLLSDLAAEFPKTKVVSDRRFVDNGRIVTAAGLSSGIDGALHVVEKLKGRGAAEATALGLEYDWHPDGSFVRARLADRLIPDVDLDGAGTFTVDHTEGTTDHWEVAVRGTPSKTPAELMALFDGALTGKGKWRSVSSSPAGASYRFEDEAGAAWTGTLRIEARGGAREVVLTLTIGRSPS